MGRFGIQLLESSWREPHEQSDDEESLDEEQECNDVEEEEEPLHPLPFSPSWGRTRFSLDPPQQSYTQLHLRYLGTAAHETSFSLQAREQQFPHLNQFWDASTACASVLVEFSQQTMEGSPTYTDEMDGITALLEATTLTDAPPKHVQVQNLVGQKLRLLADAALKDVDKLDQWRESYRKRREQQHKEAYSALRDVLKADHEAAKAILTHERQQQRQEEERVRAEEDQAKRSQEEREKELQKAAEKKEAKKVRQAQQKAEADVQRQKVEAEKMMHVTAALKLMDDLINTRITIEPFDKNPAVSKRRMNMKKVCRGKVNTLAAEVGKIQAVAAEVIAAIKAEKLEDEQMQAYLQQGAPNVTPDMAKGQLYFLDLLASSALVRIQADGFNGTRGDGFPLAAFLARVASEIPEFAPIFEAHIYTVCPMAIPSLPKPGKDATEDELMESLGMFKNKNGEYETFERFIQRTEGIISIMADIMSSHPDNHQLFGGYKMAITWLQRFLEILPRSPVQLPLNTAPVLDGFLIGAGHMLSNLYADEFKKLLTIIMTDIITRLDEGSVGAPSAFRLKETVKDGFERFQKKLPPRALDQLYNDGGSVPPPLPPGAQSGSASYTPFEASTRVSADPSSSGGACNTQAPNPFGVTSNKIVASSFGGTGDLKPRENIFGENLNTGLSGSMHEDGMMDSTGPTAQISTTFGATGTTQSSLGAPTTPSTAPFGAQSYQQSAFGVQAAPVTMPFGASSNNQSPFGTQAAPASMPFSVPNNSQNSFGAQVAAPSTPFGAPSSNQTPFGAPTSIQTPFGAQAPPAPTSFGATNNSASPFGAPAPQASTPFGATSNSTQSTFGAKTAVVSTPLGTSNTSPSPFGGTNSSFGNNQRTGNVPFGGATNSVQTPFGTANSVQTPFGGGSTATPFGATAPPTTFGGSSPFGAQSSFGSTKSQQQTPFGAQPQGSSDLAGGKATNDNKKMPPCHFFAQGRCRNGDNCKFSHDTPTGGGNTSTFESSPFGGPRR